ncbi:hypothetical protein SELMODRAFT_432335 [Selaginella moellendorffii]|uniref:Uncharacterized protein n=1 Tax=Selaginella moellendorffii TaxID=88036 RepID=D8TFP4_SELML|nr:hypothetical protein SELMODRAFT_432335 [Selaginella moellendorffii]
MLNLLYIRRMRYLSSVVNETLRLAKISPMVFRRALLGLEFNDKYLWIHPDPEKFNPAGRNMEHLHSRSYPLGWEIKLTNLPSFKSLLSSITSLLQVDCLGSQQQSFLLNRMKLKDEKILKGRLAKSLEDMHSFYDHGPNVENSSIIKKI